MKHLFLSLLLCAAGIGARAQAYSITINNNTRCEVFYAINGGNASPCDMSSGGMLSSLGPGASVTYTSSTSIPGFPSAPVPIRMAKIFTSSNTCAFYPVLQYIGDPCTGYSTMASYLVYTNPGCMICRTAPVIASWIPAPSPGGMATLNFN